MKNIYLYYFILFFILFVYINKITVFLRGYVMSRIINLRIASAFLLTFFVSFMNAEDVTSGSLAGSVLDQSGNAVAGASVVVKSANTGVERSATSNADGSVRIPVLSVGSYAVVATTTLIFLI